MIAHVVVSKAAIVAETSQLLTNPARFRIDILHPTAAMNSIKLSQDYFMVAAVLLHFKRGNNSQHSETAYSEEKDTDNGMDRRGRLNLRAGLKAEPVEYHPENEDNGGSHEFPCHSHCP